MRAYNPSSTNPLRKGVWRQMRQRHRFRFFGLRAVVNRNCHEERGVTTASLWTIEMRWCLRSLHWGHGTCFHFWGHPEIKQSVKSIHWNQYESISFSHNASSLRFFSNKICGSPTYPLYFFQSIFYTVSLLHCFTLFIHHSLVPNFAALISILFDT